MGAPDRLAGRPVHRVNPVVFRRGDHVAADHQRLAVHGAVQVRGPGEGELAAVGRRGAIPVRCAFWSNSGQAAEGCLVAAPPASSPVLAPRPPPAPWLPAGAGGRAARHAPPPVQAATTHAAAASEVPRMIASPRWRTPAAVSSAPVIRAAATRDPTKLLLSACAKFRGVSWHDG